MKNKYVMIGGLAFSEESDMKKLSYYARKGWLLEDIIGGFFYKLKKGEPQDIVYTLDYQGEANEEYFTIFKESGWDLVLSVRNQIHIFSAEAGNDPIYSDNESEMDKYITIRNRMGKGTLYSSIIAIALMGLLVISAIAVRPIFLLILGLLIIDFSVFIFNFMPYLAYSSRVKQMKKYGKCNNRVANKSSLFKLYALIGGLFLISGIFEVINTKKFSVFYIALGIFYIILSVDYYKKYKKSL